VATSGTYTYAPALSDLAIEVFERLGITAPGITVAHYQSLRRSLNQVQIRWANRGINLWKVNLVSALLVAGTATVSVDPSIIDVLDVYLSTTGSASGVGESFITDGNQVSGGLIDSSGSTVTDGTNGTGASLAPGLIGGNGYYIVDQYGNPIGTPGTSPAAPTNDILMYPLSRSDYAAIPNKTQSGRPTSYWFDRTLAPTLTLWPVPDAVLSYTLNYYAFQQMADATATGAIQPDVPYRMLEAYVAAVAAHMSIKWARDLKPMLDADAQTTWDEASEEDSEKTSIYLAPDFSSYFT